MNSGVWDFRLCDSYSMLIYDVNGLALRATGTEMYGDHLREGSVHVDLIRKFSKFWGQKCKIKKG